MAESRLKGRGTSGILIAGLASLSVSVCAQTLTFDALTSAPSVNGDVAFVTANGGSRVLQGVTFDAAPNADWEIVGNQYLAPSSSSIFAESHSGTYSLAGNAFSGVDFFGATYTGLTLSTSARLTALYVGFDNDGGGATDADSLTITAFGASGDLAAVTTTLTGPALALLNVAPAFSALSGIAGYRFETTAADALNQAYGRAYVIADDLTFAAPVPEPAVWSSLAAGLAMIGWKRRGRARPGSIL